MLINVKSFNGFALQNTDFRSAGVSFRSQADATNVFVEQVNAEPMDSGAFSLQVRAIPVKIKIIDQVNKHVLSAQLREALRPGTEGDLLVTFTDENRDYKIRCRVQSIAPDQVFENLYQVIFQTGQNAWESADEVTDTWSITASGDEKTLTVGGYSDTRLSLALTATGLPVTGWAYQRMYQLVNPLIYGYGKRPWCITLDTAALVTAGKIQADCDDLTVVVDGVIVRRWLAAPNTSATKIWFNVDLAVGQTLALNVPVASSGAITDLYMATNATNRLAMSKLPKRGILNHGTEWFEYTNWTYSKNETRFMGVTRGAFSTTLQAHAQGDAFRSIQHVIHVLYGNSAAVAPATLDDSYDDEKPIFDLAQSTNSSWVYTSTTGFYDEDKPLRGGAWKPAIVKAGTESENYLITGNAESGDPAMGMRIASWYRLGKITADVVTASWALTCPGLISSVSATGRKYRSHASWAAVKAFRLEKSANPKSWFEVWYEVSPTAAATWETVTKNSQAITPNMASVRFVFTGSVPALADVQNMAEILTCTVDFVAGNLPTGTFLTEKSNYLLDVTLTNETTNEAIRLVYPMLLNVAIDVDGEEFTVTYGDVNAHAALSLDDESRDIWLSLAPGANVINIAGDGVGTMTAALRWVERRR